MDNKVTSSINTFANKVCYKTYSTHSSENMLWWVLYDLGMLPSANNLLRVMFVDISNRKFSEYMIKYKHTDYLTPTLIFNGGITISNSNNSGTITLSGISDYSNVRVYVQQICS